MKNIFSALVFIPTMIYSQNSEGPHSSSAAENTSCPFSYSSTTDYLPAENVFASDNIYATASHCDCCDMNTRCLETKGYAFNIPLTATINGIVVEVERKASPGSTIQDNGVKLMKAGNTTGSSYATANNWLYVDSYSSYGGPNDLWGSNWLPADINDAGFGLAFAAISYTCFGTDSAPAATSYIDNIRLTVYYTDIATSISFSQSATALQMIIAPNPALNGNVSILLPQYEKYVKISVDDISGRRVAEKILEINSGNLNYTFNLPNGIYVIRLEGATNTYMKKLVVE